MGTTSGTVSTSSCPGPCYPSPDHKLSPSQHTGFPRPPRPAPCPRPPSPCTGSTKLLPSSGVRCTRGHRQRVVGPLISGPHSAAMPEARALLSRMEVSPPNLQPRSRLLARGLAAVSYSAGCAETCFGSHLICLTKRSAVHFPENVF